MFAVRVRVTLSSVKSGDQTLVVRVRVRVRVEVGVRVGVGVRVRGRGRSRVRGRGGAATSKEIDHIMSWQKPT